MDKKVYVELVRAIAAALPDQWRYNERAEQQLHSRCSAEIIGERGKVLYFRERWEKKNMVSVSCGWPRLGRSSFDPHHVGALKHDASRLGINFSPSRTPVAIANDIKRRLLTDYVSLFDQCLASKAQRERDLEQIRYQVEQLGRVGKLRPSAHNNHYESEVSLSRYFPQAGACNYRVSIYSGESRIELTSVPMDLAIKIAGLIDAHFEDKE